MAVGLPALASPVGVNRDIVRHGEKWIPGGERRGLVPPAYAALCRDRELRRRIGDATRTTVEAQYSLKHWGPALAERYAAIIDNTNRPYSRPAVAQPVSR